MSQLYLVNLKKHNMKFEDLKDLSNNLMQLALKNNFAIFFNSFDYANEIILEGKMKDFFLLSDCFLYKNCGFLNTQFLEDISDYNACQKKFLDKFYFLNLINETIFKNYVYEIEVFITEDGAVDSIKDFDVIKCTTKEYLKELFDSIIRKADEYAYGFPTVKFIIYNYE